VGAALVLGLVLMARPAQADDAPRLSLDWAKLGEVLRQGPAVLLPREHDPEHTEHGERTESSEVPLAERRWVGLAPRMSLVARDWGDSQLLVGNLTLTDQMRLTRSSRMVVSRVRLAEGRLVPFAQLGVGEWRVDRSIMPALPLDQQLAAQAGAGFELTLTPDVVVAIETDCTLLWNDDTSMQMLAIARGNLWGSLLAARARF
jgi:hypothetical protein